MIKKVIHFPVFPHLPYLLLHLQTPMAVHELKVASASVYLQLKAEAGTCTGPCGISVAHETCGHDIFAKLRSTVCIY